MRKVFILFILFSISFALKGAGILSDTHNSVLLAIGLVILAAYTLSEVGSTLKLPRVTGYILTGLLLGPYALKILSVTVVKEIEMFNTLAIGLIATTAGLELHFSSLKKVIAPILSTSALKILFLAITSVGAFYIANMYIHDFGLGMGLPLISLALVFAALALGTSPAISIAVISEMKAKSRMSQMVLGSAIVKDVLVVVILAVCISFTKSITIGGGDIGSSFLHLMEELAYSLLAGGVLGALFIGYLKFVRKEMFLFIAAMILTTAEVSQTLHLELLLVFIVAGIVVRNFCEEQHILHEALEKVSLPVFVVFFTNVGAGLDLTSTWAFLPVAGLLFATRALSFIGGSWLAGAWHGESAPIQKKIWLGYLPQAGVTLGLIQIASKSLPEHASIITNVGIGLVTLNLLIGPIFLRMVLQAEEPQGDTEEESTQDSTTIEDVQSERPPQKPAEVSEFDSDFDLMLHSHTEDMDDPLLEKQYYELSQAVYDVFKKSQVLPQKAILNTFLEALEKMGDLPEKEIVNKIDDHFRKMGEKGRDIYNAIAAYKKEVDRQVVVMKRPYPASGIYLQKGDSVVVQAKKLMQRPYYWFAKRPTREIPLRKIAKYNLDPMIGAFSLSMINSWYRLLGKHIAIFQKSLEDHEFNSTEIIEKISKENEIWFRSIQSDFHKEFSQASNRWVSHLRNVNTPALPDTHLRYSQVEPQISENFERAKKFSVNWEEKFVYCRNRLKVIVQSALLSNAVETLLDEKFFGPVNTAKTNTDLMVKDVFSFFDRIERELKETESFDKTAYEKLHQDTKAFSEDHLQAEIKTKYVRGSFRLLNRDISLNLKKNLPKEEGSFQIASEQTPADQVSSPSEIIVKKINLTELFEQSILINFLPVIEERIEGVSNYLESLLLEMEQAFSIIHYSLESQIAGESELNPKELTDSLLTSITSEREKINEIYEGLVSYIDSSSIATEKLLEEVQGEVRLGIERFSVVNTAKNQFRQRLYNIVQKGRQLKHDVDDKIDSAYQKIKKLGIQQTEREVDRAISNKIQSKTLDTTTIRQFIKETYSFDRELKKLPRVYFRLFSLDPIQDRRFFVAHRDRWRHFEPFTRDQGFTESQKILVIGDRGIGKSSLINVAQMEIQNTRLIRIDGESQGGPLNELTRALGCKNNNASILAALRKNGATIVMDNVDQMLSKNNLDRFERLFDIIKQSPHEAHWILSITSFNLDPLDRAFKIRSLFNKLIDLNEINLETCKEIILGRHRLSGLEIEYPRTLMSDLAMKVGFSSEDEMFFRVLYERSGGHLRHLIYLWLLSLEDSDGKKIKLSLNRSIDRGLPMIHEFSVLQKYILHELYSFHSLSVQQMSQNLGVSYSIVDNETQYLEHCGLIETKGIDRSVFEIPNPLVMPVGTELKKEGVLNEGFNNLRL